MSDYQRQIINKNVMRDLIGDDDEIIKKFQLEFLKQAKSSLNKIVNLYNNNKILPIKEEAHYLKTSAKAIGAEETGYLLEGLEEMALDNEKDKCKQQIVYINKALKQVYGVITNES